jgi:hypothetical protein
MAREQDGKRISQEAVDRMTYVFPSLSYVSWHDTHYWHGFLKRDEPPRDEIRSRKTSPRTNSNGRDR